MAVGVAGALIYLIFASNGQALEREAVYFGLVLSTAFLIWNIYSKATKIVIEKEETPLDSE